jgi:putative zinc finger/helix-turn-helix YgiT family protein
MTAERCLACGEQSTIHELVVPLLVESGGKSKVIQDRRMVCERCNNVSYIGSQISEHERAVAAAVRELEGLLSAEELQRIRAKYRLKQTDMEQMLSTGPKTWTRWERGKVPQSKATDKLIRLIADDPDVARRLMELAGIINPDAATAFERIEADAKRISTAAIRAELRRLQGGDIEHVADNVADKAFESIRDARRQAAARAEAA